MTNPLTLQEAIKRYPTLSMPQVLKLMEIYNSLTLIERIEYVKTYRP